MALRKNDPRTKEELLDRMLSFDFDGDIRHLGAKQASIVRQGPNRLLLSFPNSGRVFELSVHIPREREQWGRRSEELRNFSDEQNDEPAERGSAGAGDEWETALRR